MFELNMPGGKKITCKKTWWLKDKLQELSSRRKSAVVKGYVAHGSSLRPAVMLPAFVPPPVKCLLTTPGITHMKGCVESKLIHTHTIDRSDTTRHPLLLILSVILYILYSILQQGKQQKINKRI